MKFQSNLEGRELQSRPARIDVDFGVRVRCKTGDLEARIVNLSGSGFRLRSSEPLQVGWIVALHVAKTAPIKGVIRWTCEQDSGGLFLESAIL